MKITYKLLGGVELLLACAVAALLIPSFRKMHDQVVEGMQKELRAVATTGALQLDGDLHRRLPEQGERAPQAFEALRTVLTGIRDANGIDYEHIYTLYRDGQTMRFGVMTHPDPFRGDPYPIQPGMLKVLERGEAHVTGLYRDEYGRWMSAYAPIRATNGTVVGLLEVDIAAESYFTRLRSLLWVTGALGCVALVLASLLGWPLLNATIIRPIGRLRAGMLALRCHDFTHRVELRTGDEFEALGRTLNQVSEQLNAARAIQSRFFPKTMPDLPGFCLAGMSTPSEAAGGDYLDALQLGPDRAALLVADVSGHGLGPALLMATCRATVRALARADLSPADLLEGLESVLRADLSAGQFVTMLYGVLESDGTFTYANAGHGPALLLQGDVVRSLEAHRFPLGMDLPFEPGAERQSSITLSPGDRLLVATDGLVDATGADGEPFGVEPVEGAMRDRSCNCRQLVAHLEEGIRSHCRDAPQTDDITILCVDRA